MAFACWTKSGSWRRLVHTLLVNITYFATLGLGDSLKGPTMLDLADIYYTTIEQISFMVVATAVGSIIGSLFSGIIMDKYPRRRNLVMLILHILNGIQTILIPRAPNVYLLFVLTFGTGITAAAMHIGCNVTCLDIWKGLNSGPPMHSIHFSWALGAFLAPIIATPFLSTSKGDNATMTLNHNLEANNSIEVVQEGRVTTLYTIIGTLSILTVLGYLWIEIIGTDRGIETEEEMTRLRSESKPQEMTCTVGSLIVVIVTVFFLFDGTQMVMNSYLTTFAVECGLHLTKAQGATLTAIFWGSFAAMRFAAIFVAMFYTPNVLMSFCLCMCTAGCAAMAIFAEDSHILLQISAGVIGIGLAPAFATGILWMEQYIVITSKISSLFLIVSCFGHGALPLIIGQYITVWPMLLAYLSLLSSVGCLVGFLIASFLGRAVIIEKTSNVK